MRRKTLDDTGAEGTLAHEVLQADTLILVIDASAPAAQVDADFQEFGRFLRLLERGRGQRTEVGGLPVFLVLTKCDLLAKPGDTALAWIEHVEERKRQVDRRFQEFLAGKTAADGTVPFGRIDLHLWATAVKRPALAEAPARPREPYGVAELFRQCLQAARVFRRRRRRSSRRLLATVVGAAGLAVLLAGGALWIGTRPGRSSQAADLQNRIENYQFQQGQTPAERLHGSPEQIAQRIALVSEFHDDPHFGELPAPVRSEVNDWLLELKQYDVYYRKVLEARPPAEARTLPELLKMDETLQTTLALPHEDWSQTRAGRRRQDQLDDVGALRKAVKTADDWYAGLREEGEALWTFARRQPGANGASIDWTRWQKDVSALLHRADTPPFRDSDRLRGPESPTWHDSVLRFDSAVLGQGEWDRTRGRLQRLLALSAALGLGRGSEHPSLLVFSPGPFTAADARARLEELQKDYPAFEDSFQPKDLPEAAKRDVQQAARASYEVLLESGRAAVLHRLEQAATGDRETTERWAEVRRWLQANPEELASWRSSGPRPPPPGRARRNSRSGGGTDPVPGASAFRDQGDPAASRAAARPWCRSRGQPDDCTRGGRQGNDADIRAVRRGPVRPATARDDLHVSQPGRWGDRLPTGRGPVGEAGGAEGW